MSDKFNLDQKFSQAEVAVFEPAATRNTGNLVDATFTAPEGARV